MIDPFEKIGAGLLTHPLRQPPGKRTAIQEGLDAPTQQLLGFIGQRPIKTFRNASAGTGLLGRPFPAANCLYCGSHENSAADSSQAEPGESSQISSWCNLTEFIVPRQFKDRK